MRLFLSRTRYACLILAAVAELSACGSDPAGGRQEPGSAANAAPADPDLLGSVTLELTTVPAGIQCLSITAANGGPNVTKTIAVTAGASSLSVSVGQLPLGTISFTAWAYSVACASIATATPTWIADPVTALLEPGVASTVNLDFRKNNPVNAKVSFIGNIVNLTASGSSSFEIESDGTASWWGSVAAGIVANTVQPLSIVSQAVQIVAGSNHACYLKSTGTVFCWGLNSNSQIPGAAANATVTTPLQVPGITDATAITAGGSHTCALSGNGSVLCWGLNASGQLGNGTMTTSATPVTVSSIAFTVAAVDAGLNHTCARLKSGGAMCWGSNATGELGDGTVVVRPSPVTVSALPAIKEIGAGNGHSCAILVDGTIRCWGSNFSGEIGDGTLMQRATSVAVSGITGATSLAVGSLHNCAIATGGLKCWGNNGSGAVGTGALANVPIPQLVPGLSAALRVTAGYGHTCALLPSQDVMCWGQNDLGQVGDGTRVFAFSPVQVPL